MPNASIPYRRALVTGASSGIGRALCFALDGAGVETITLVARNRTLLKEVADGLSCNVEIVIADLTQTADLEAVLEHAERSDLIINNAGVGSFGPFHSMDIQRELSMIDLNCRAPVHLAFHALSGMVTNGHGCIVNIASGMAFQAMPYMSIYAASKAFLLHWSEAVNAELSGTGVRVVTICPGTIHTNFATASMVPVNEIPGTGLVTGTIEDVVSSTLNAIAHNKAIAIPGFRHRLVQALSRLTPRGLARYVTAWAMANTHKQING